MAKAGKCSFDLICRKHGKVVHTRSNKPVLGVEPTGKKRNRCPLCIKVYIQRHNMNNVNGIDWRYVDLES